jgi:phosphate transport system permease protein
MSTSLSAPPGQAPSPFDSPSLRANTLPRWAPLAVIAGAVVVALLLNLTTSVHGYAGTIVIAVLLYLIGQTAWSFGVEGGRHARDRLATTLIWSCFVIAMIPLVAILVEVIEKGHNDLNWHFLYHSMRNVGARDQGGGVYHAILGTLEQVGFAAVLGIPIGILVAIYLVEFGRGPLARAISFFVDVMTGVPSIVAGSLALAILMIPIVVRSTEEMLKLVPNELRESAYALGVPKYVTILRIVVPTAMTGIITGCMLSVARVTGETAPLLLTTFLSQSINRNPFSGPQASLPTFIWDQISSGTNDSISRAWAGALTLIILVLLLNVVARVLARFSRVG